jgi:hypothetical protein
MRLLLDNNIKRNSILETGVRVPFPVMAASSQAGQSSPARAPAQLRFDELAKAVRTEGVLSLQVQTNVVDI